KVIEETKEELPDQPAQTVAIIACLNIAYDLFLEKNKNREFLIQANDKIKRLKLLLNESEMSAPS
ncbi:MAG: cell division protein ZapA, partial [Ignavibacteriaceae bacterium]|nr:cell division protein ZapA [Ignavibacteriaceae bacterium]